MNFLIVLGVLILLTALLVFLSVWQQKIEDLQRERVIADLRDAKERGTDRPIAQHPQIDEQACIGCGSCVAACPEDGVLGLVDGIARVIHGSRCIGHALCEEVCPVNAVKVSLGDISSRTDIPSLSESLETSVPGVYIAGELGGFALIRIAVEQGTKAVSAIALELGSRGSTRRPGVFDVLIVGAGPAGFAASLRAKECGLSHVTIDMDDIGGTVRKYPRRKLTLTGPVTLPLYGPVKKREFLKEELIEFWESVARKFDLTIHSGVKLLGAKHDKGCFEAQTSKGVVRAKRIVLTLGRRGTPRRLGVPGEDQEKVLYQLVDAATYTNEKILVVGGGDSAIEAATALAEQNGNTVTLSYRRHNFFRLKARNQERIERYARDGRVKIVFNSVVERIDPDSVTLSISKDDVRRNKQLPNDYTLIFAGGEPPYPLLHSLGIQFGGESDGSTETESPATVTTTES